MISRAFLLFFMVFTLTLTGAVFAEEEILPENLQQSELDACGNPVGTTYSEGAACTSYRAADGPFITYKTPWEEWLSKLAVGFAATLVGLLALVHLVSIIVLKRVDTEKFMQYYTLIVIIGSSVFVLIAGYSDQQIAPLFALFGTLVGYIFGTTQEQQRTQNQRDAQNRFVQRSSSSNQTSESVEGETVKGKSDEPVKRESDK